MQLLDLPSEILCEIINLCGPGVMTETCRIFSDIAASTPALWTSVRLGPLQFVPEGRERLLTRLGRTANSLLTVSVGPVQDEGTVLPDLSPGGIIRDLCTILSDWSAQISHIHVHAETTVGAGIILRTIFHDLTSSVVFFALQSLSVRVECDYDFLCDCLKPMDLILYSVLAGSYKHFPRLQVLSIPSYGDCMPSVPANATFSHLHTLVLDGVREEGTTDICTVTELLSNTPRLETLWLKHDDQSPDDAALNPVPNWEMYHGDYPLRVFLPHLVRLAISAPGTGTDLLYCLEAPSLEDLHLDGSRSISISWDDDDEAAVQAALKSFASRSSGLRRLAFTQTSLPRCGFEWLLFGDGGRPPFPRLETLALRGYVAKHYDLDDDLLLRFARQPTIPLRRLVILQCTLSFKGSTFLKVFQGVLASAPNKKYELEIDCPCPCGRITDDGLDTLEEIGVRLIRRREGEARMDKWWTLGHEADMSDSCAY